MNLPVGTTVLGLSPFEQPDSSLVAAVARAGALGLLDLGHDPAVAREALARAARRIRVPFGVRFNERLEFAAVSLPEEVAVVVVPAARGRFAWAGRDAPVP